jgi:preprotein translocase subunit SecA
MAFNLLTQIFGSRNDRLLKKFRKTLERINGLEASYELLSDEDLRQKTNEFKQRSVQGEALKALSGS